MQDTDKDMVEKVTDKVAVAISYAWAKNLYFGTDHPAFRNALVEAAVAAHEQALAEEGMVIVPEEPDENTVWKGMEALDTCNDLGVVNAYRAMIAAFKAGKE